MYKYIVFQDDMRRFIVNWNHIGLELNLPELDYQYGSLFKDIQELHNEVKLAQQIAIKTWEETKNELKQLFPHGINITNLPFQIDEIEKAIRAIELNTSRVSLGAQRSKLNDLVNKIKSCNGDVSERIKEFLNKKIGNPEFSSDYILKNWQSIVAEVNRLNLLLPTMETLTAITQTIENSGALIWSKALKTTPWSNREENSLTPSDWFESWQWKRREQYLHSIDGREKLVELSDLRATLDKDLKRCFTELVRLKTHIGLHKNMTERVQGALMRFVSAIRQIGKGTGKRAPRHKRSAYKAMQDCYSGVPCWIMPTWRISESLPSDFGLFDLVIFDEASQSDITALPAVLRAKKLLVVGDDKQVSPTAAFFAEEKILQLKHNFLKGQPFSDLLVPGVSLYDLASAVFPGNLIMLNEHFRCVEPIIRFSMQFYNDQLIPLRLPKTSEKLDPPLIHVFVPDGVRDERNKVNKAEAEAVVEEIKRAVFISEKKESKKSPVALSQSSEKKEKIEKKIEPGKKYELQGIKKLVHSGEKLNQCPFCQKELLYYKKGNSSWWNCRRCGANPNDSRLQ